MSTQVEETFYKQAFAKTSKQRQDKVIQEAIKVFAANGYKGTNINIVAKQAGISIGAMYSYFGSKKDLFLTIVSQQYSLLDKILTSINTDDDFFHILSRLFELTRENALKYPLLSQIYMDVTSQSMAEMAMELSETFEDKVALFLIDAIEHAKLSGEIRPDTNTRVLAYCIDNLLVMFQFSFSSAYYQKRLTMYLGDDIEAEGPALINAILRIIKNQL